MRTSFAKVRTRADRGCVEDQPQHGGQSESSRTIHALRLTLRAQPRSGLFAEAGAQIFFQAGEGGFKDGVVLPVGEIGDVMFADGFRQIFAAGGSHCAPWSFTNGLRRI